MATRLSSTLGTLPRPLTSGIRGLQGRPYAAVGLIIVLAVVLRVALWVQARSLWLDEARLALNIATRSYWRLLPPLDYDQAAPLLFLWIQRAVVDLFGVTEGALRLVPLVAGIAVVALVWPMSRRLFGERVGLLATLLAATSPSLVSASGEVKQYMTEALVGCAVLWVALRWLERPDVAARWRWVVGLGIVAVWLASSAVFVLAGAGAAAALAAGEPLRRRIHRVAVAGACWGSSAALAYLAVYRQSAREPYLRHYWEPAFLTPGRPGVLIDGAIALKAVLGGPLARDSITGSSARGTVVLIVAIFLALVSVVVVGAHRLARRSDPAVCILVLLPPVLVPLASMIRIYPISARTTMFLVPVLLTLFAAGLDELAGRIGSTVLARCVRLAPAFLFLWVTTTDLSMEIPREDLRPLVGRLQGSRRAGEPVYVFAGAIPAWAYYSTRWESPDRERLTVLKGIARAGGPAFENAPTWYRLPHDAVNALVYRTAAGPELYGSSTGLEAHVFGLKKPRPDPGWAEQESRRIRAVARPSIWLLFSHFYGPEGELLDQLDAAGGRRTFQEMRNGAALIRYEFPSRYDHP